MFRLSHLFFIACEQAVRSALAAVRRLVLKYLDATSRIRAFLKPHFFFAWTSVEGALNHSGEQFKKDAVPVSGIKICIFLKKRPGLVWTWP